MSCYLFSGIRSQKRAIRDLRSLTRCSEDIKHDISYLRPITQAILSLKYSLSKKDRLLDLISSCVNDDVNIMAGFSSAYPTVVDYPYSAKLYL